MMLWSEACDALSTKLLVLLDIFNDSLNVELSLFSVLPAALHAPDRVSP